MSDFLTPETVAKTITALVARNKLWAKKNVRLSFIVNNTAGCFTIKQKSIEYKKVFEDEYNACQAFPECTASVEYKIMSTQYARHAQELTQGAIAEYIGLNNQQLEMIIVTCGGDGTCLEVQETLYKEAQKNPEKKQTIMNNITLLRLPLGTGNDGTDGHNIQETFDMLKSALVYKNATAIKVYPENSLSDEECAAAEKACGKKIADYCDVNYKYPWYGFNIVSIGLDAYVVYLSNAIKKRIPGQVYHLAVPLSGVIYDKDFKVGTAHIEFFDEEGNCTSELTSSITLLAFGASGHRTYGSGQKVLPDDRNICFTRKVSLLEILKESRGYAKGLHFENGVSQPYNAYKVRISYDKPILFQSDGEVAMLTPKHFPLIIEKTDPCIRVLARTE